MKRHKGLQLHILLFLAMALLMAFPVSAEGEEPLSLVVEADPDCLLSQAGEMTFFRFTLKNTLDVAYELQDLMLNGELLDNDPKLIASQLTINANDVLEFTFENVRIEEDEFDRDLTFQITWRTVSYAPEDVDRQTAFINDHAIVAPIRIERFVEPVMTIGFEPDVFLAREGDPVMVTYTLVNDTKFDMTNITLQDAGLPQPNIVLERNTLLAGEQMRVQASFSMGENDLNLSPSAQYTVRGIESKASAADTITVEHVRVGLQMDIEKYPATAEGTLFSIAVTNTGSHPMTDIHLSDEIGTVLSRDFSLEAGASRTVSYTVPSAVSSGTVRYISFVATGTDCIGGSIAVSSPSAYEVLPYVDSDQVRLTLAVTLNGSTALDDGNNRLKLLFEVRNDSTVPITGAVIAEGDYFRSNVNEYPTLATGTTTFEKEFIVPAGTRSLTFVMTAMDPSQTQYSTAPMTLDLSPLAAPKPTNPPAIRPGKTVDITGTIYDTDRYVRILRYAALITLALTMVFVLLSIIFHVAEVNIRRWLPREAVVRPFGPKKTLAGPVPARTEEARRDPIRAQFGYLQPAKLRYMDRTDRFAPVEEAPKTLTTANPSPLLTDTLANNTQASAKKMSSRRRTGEITAVSVKKPRLRPVMITSDDTAPFSLPREATEAPVPEAVVLRKIPVEVPAEPVAIPIESPVEERMEPFADIPVEPAVEAIAESFVEEPPEPYAEGFMEPPAEALREITAEPEPEATAQPRIIETKPQPRVIPRQRLEIVRVSAL